MNKVSTYRNGVMIFTAFLQGYGGPDEERAWAIYNNKVLAKHFGDSISVPVERWRVRFHRMSKVDVEHLAKNKPQFTQCCDQCQQPLYEGWISQGYLLRCKPCSDKMGYKEAEAVPEILARAKQRALVSSRKERKLREQRAKNPPPEE